MLTLYPGDSERLKDVGTVLGGERQVERGFILGGT